MRHSRLPCKKDCMFDQLLCFSKLSLHHTSLQQKETQCSLHHVPLKGFPYYI